MKKVAVSIVAAACLLACGSSPEQHAENRRAELLALFPPGSTTRADIAAKLSPNRPDLSELRPDDGWKAAVRRDVASYALASERRSGRAVHRCERYSGPDPDTFLGLERNWFFFDEADVLLDVAWQYQSD